jgi:hypothetical protein
MNMHEYYQKREASLRTEWFKDHQAHMEEFSAPTIQPTVLKRITRLLWARPGTTNYWCSFIICGQALMVYGDIGEAVYGWNDKITFEFLKGLDLDYFASKCCASEHGRGFHDWDMRVAKEKLKEYLMDNPVHKAQATKELFADARGAEALGHKEEWIFWLNQNGWDVFGEVFTDLGDIGQVIAHRCQGHLVGIKMAMEQLSPAKQIETTATA